MKKKKKKKKKKMIVPNPLLPAVILKVMQKSVIEFYMTR